MSECVAVDTERGSFRHIHHAFNLFPSESVNVAVTEKNLFLMIFQHIYPCVYLVPQADKVCHLFLHAR